MNHYWLELKLVSRQVKETLVWFQYLQLTHSLNDKLEFSY